MIEVTKQSSSSRLLVTRPFSFDHETRRISFSHLMFMTPEQVRTSPELLRDAFSYFNEVYIEEALHSNYLKTGGDKLLPLRPIPNFVRERLVPKRIFFLASNDTHASTLTKLAEHIPNVEFLIPDREKKEEGAAAVISGKGFRFREIPYPPQKPTFNLSNSVVLAGADWTSEFKTVDLLRKKDISITTIVYQEGPHDWWCKISTNKGPLRLNQMRHASIALLQGQRTLSMIRPSVFSITGLPKTDTIGNYRAKESSDLRVFVNYNFTYIENKPDYESRGPDWLRLVEEALASEKLDFIVSVHPRSKPPNSVGTLVYSSSETLGEHLQECEIVISRFSSVLIEALARGKEVVYFNPFHEPMATFQRGGLKSIRLAKTKDELRTILLSLKTGRRSAAEDKSADLNSLSLQTSSGSAFLLSELVSGIAGNEPESRMPKPAGKPETHELAVAAKKGLVVVVCPMPRMGYSGGRYHVVLLCTALAAAGFQVTLLTNNFPVFLDDFLSCAGHLDVEIILTPDFVQNVPVFGRVDTVVCVPGMKDPINHYEASVHLSATTGAKLVLLNFETPNWFNETAFKKRAPALWANWNWVSRRSDVVLSSTHIGSIYAQEFFKRAAEAGTKFDTLSPGINSVVADSVAPSTKRDRVLMISRFGQNSIHKGANMLQNLIDRNWAGFTVTIISDGLDSESILSLESTVSRNGAKLEVLRSVSDHEKFLILSQSAVCIIPSSFEGFGLPLIEAAYLGVPCVAFNLPVYEETLGESLTTVPLGDWKVMRTEVSGILSRGQSAAITEELRRRAHQIGSYESFVKRACSVFLGIQNGSTPNGIQIARLSEGQRSYRFRFQSAAHYVVRRFKSLASRASSKAKQITSRRGFR